MMAGARFIDHGGCQRVSPAVARFRAGVGLACVGRARRRPISGCATTPASRVGVAIGYKDARRLDHRRLVELAGAQLRNRAQGQSGRALLLRLRGRLRSRRRMDRARPSCARATRSSPSAASTIAWRAATTAPAFSRSIPASSDPGPCSSPKPAEQPPQNHACRQSAQLPFRRPAAAERRPHQSGDAVAGARKQGPMRRQRRTKIVATLGPASCERAVIGKLFDAGADVFRINMSHTSHDGMRELVATIRAVEAEYNRPIGILVDLQGPKLRLGAFKDDAANLDKGQEFVLDTDPTPGRRNARVPAASGNLRRDQAGRHAAASTTASCAWQATETSPAAHRRARRSRRQAVEPQGRQPARHRRSARGADAEGPSPISKPRSMPASTGWRCPSSSARRTSPRPRRSRAAAPR